MGKDTRQLWKAYVEGKSTGKPPVSNPNVRIRSFRGVVLGIDPSLRGTGLSIVRFSDGGKLELLHRDTIRVRASEPVMVCLSEIHERFEAVLEQFPIDHVAVEQTIYVQNYKTAMVLGTAKGAALGVIARKQLPLFEYPPLRVKQAVVGAGRASKEQVAVMVSRLLGFEGWTSPDETDAAGVALCHGFTWKES